MTQVLEDLKTETKFTPKAQTKFEDHYNTPAAERLTGFILRVEKLEEEKAALAGDVREVYAEAKGAGFDVKVMRQIVRLRKMDQSDRAEMEELMDIYKRALGMV
jgi:uncharacterized protein (UPF0335 family)